MNRRKFLMTGITVGVSTLAGCSQSGQDQAREHLSQAGTALQKAGNQISSESAKLTQSKFEEGGVDIETSAINGYLQAAREELDSAERTATNEQQEKINAARRYVGFANEFTTFLDFFAVGYSLTHTGLTYFRSQEYTGSVMKLSAAENRFSTASDHLTVAQNELEKIDADVLTDLTSVQLSSTRDSLSDLDQLVSSLRPMVRGIEQTSQGMMDFRIGRNAMETDLYRSAEKSFRAASTDFSSAQSTFQAEENEAPTQIKSTFIQLSCYASSFQEASTHLANSMSFYQSGNYERAQSEAQAAEEATNRCDFS